MLENAQAVVDALNGARPARLRVHILNVARSQVDGAQRGCTKRSFCVSEERKNLMKPEEKSPFRKSRDGGGD